jgi:hypothetical protein
MHVYLALAASGRANSASDKPTLNAADCSARFGALVNGCETTACLRSLFTNVHNRWSSGGCFQKHPAPTPHNSLIFQRLLRALRAFQKDLILESGLWSAAGTAQGEAALFWIVVLPVLGEQQLVTAERIVVTTKEELSHNFAYIPIL